jgi:hypothetical protein
MRHVLPAARPDLTTPEQQPLLGSKSQTISIGRHRHPSGIASLAGKKEEGGVFFFGSI